ncbi:ObirOr5-U65 [Ooceraea biroi]|uniref:Odorant receptor n=3 Tax=Ooceraea biroi TaxID=2015173 RepID=A0A3L8DKV3_OOCBI|nr:ObirOr5-U65 [Ooceraea biroi]
MKIAKYANDDSNDIDKKIRYKNFEWATHLNYLILNAIGIWPMTHKRVYDKVLSDLRAILTFIIITFIGVIPAIHSLLRTWGDMMLMIDNLQYTLPLITTVMKLVVIWWKKPDLVLVINMIAEDWIKAKTDKELYIMIKQAQNTRIVTMIGYVFMVMGITLLVILPCFGKSVRYTTNITDPNKLLPLQTYYLYDKDQSPFFELTFAAQTVVIFMSGATYGGIDTLLGLLIFHLCGQMENLREKFITMSKFKTFHSGLVFIVRDHIRLIKYFDTIESIFTVLLLGLLIYFSTLFCLYGFLIIAILTERSQMSTMRFMYLVSVMINFCGYMCLFCAAGERLVTQCEAMYYAAYEYEWYKLEPKKAKVLVLLMIRTSKPLYITAGKIFPMTMSTFCNIIKTSAGYVSVLLAMQS